VSSSHNNGDCGRRIANELIISLQSDRPAPYRCSMVSSIPNTFAGGREINASRQIFRVGWISSTCGRTLLNIGQVDVNVNGRYARAILDPEKADRVRDHGRQSDHGLELV
jgi:hypothetical protein